MVTISINGETKIDNYEESWIIQAIQRSIKEGIIPCVRITVKSHSVDIGLATSGCGSAVGSFRSLTTQEQKIVNLWRDRGLDQIGFTGGNVIAFLKQLRSLL